MLKVGPEEIDAIAKVIRSGKLFRHNTRGECARFERRFAKYLGVQRVHLTASGTSALTAAIAGLGIGPGDEVLVPAHTWVATPLAVLNAGAIPVVVDIDQSLTMDPAALADAIGPRTRAVIPVHMWGLPCDMNAIMRIARRRKLLVIEDACQAAGGAYDGRMLGSIGDAGAFSFNFYKNMTCGEGGAFVTRRRDVRPVVADGARASEIEGAMLNVQLDRISGLIARARRRKKEILREVAGLGVVAAPCHSLEFECGTTVAFRFATPQAAMQFARRTKGTLVSKTGKHNHVEWALPQVKYAHGTCARSSDIVKRTVAIDIRPDSRVDEILARINAALRARS
jgi:dTDP-4-amino-4,6-dideoxygalactose transaminase